MVIKIESLYKRFGSRKILNGISFSVEQGSVFALIGPNGAGKTTIIRCLSGEMLPDAGHIEMFGKKFVPSMKNRIALVSESRYSFRKFSGYDYLRSWRILYPQFDEAIFRESLAKQKIGLNQMVETYSMGMRTMFFNTLALSSSAEVVILDEPFQHLDPLMRAHLAVMIKNFVADKKKTIVLSSHEIYEIEEIADSFAIIKGGEALYFSSIEEARKAHDMPKLKDIVLGFLDSEKTIGDMEG